MCDLPVTFNKCFGMMGHMEDCYRAAYMPIGLCIQCTERFLLIQLNHKHTAGSFQKYNSPLGLYST